MPRISSPRPLDLTKPFLTSSQSHGSQPFDLSESLVTWYRDIQGDFVPDLSGRGNNARCAGSGSHDRVIGSNDAPEYNPNNYPLQSFDLSDDAGSYTNVRHIRSINGTGQVASLDDHTFADDSGDVPFSISFWLKSNSTTGNQYIISKGAQTSSPDSYEWTIVGSGTSLLFILYSAGNVSNTIRISSVPNAIVAGSWHHYVLTYDGSATDTGLKMYKDGGILSSSPSTSGTYSGMLYPSSLALCIGSAFTSTTYDVNNLDFIGKLHSIAIWKNRVISLTEASALYNAYINGPGGESRSGFISRSPRLMLRELDDLPGSYSTVRRTGDPTRTGALTSNFNDETTIVFSESGNAVFPAMLPKGSSFSSQAVDIIGQESDISASLPIRSFQHPAHLHYSPTEAVGPFDENRVIPATDFFLSGTSPDVLPGFQSPVRSKIAIDIDITPQSEITLTRNVSRRNTAEGQPVSPDNTGFYYYNFNRKEWEQIGLQDPATGTAIYYDFAIDVSPANASGTFPNQFTFGNGSAKERDDLVSAGDVRIELGYSKIGSPTVVMGAPSATKYHATSSQSLKLSNLISSPFMLESVAIELGNVKAQRINGGSIPSSGDFIFKSGSIRDIDNYVFFMYRQSRANRVVDSLADVSSSSRFLVCSASMTFWNSASLSGSSWSPATLLHSPAFSYEFGLPYDDVYSVGSFTGSVQLETRPTICGAQNLGVSRVPEADGTGTNFIQNSWCGGSTLDNVTLFGDSSNTVLPFNQSIGESLNDVIKRGAKVDHRSFRKFGGEVQDQTQESLTNFGFTSTVTPQSNHSPYILFPEDEIIFGLECGIPQAPFSALVSNITGSHLQIGNEKCKVRLFGSLIKNYEEYATSLNQDLSSNSIHEMISVGPVLDQFMIEPRSSYYGSYIDEIVTGSMITLNSNGTFTIYDQDNSRRVISRRST